MESDLFNFFQADFSEKVESVMCDIAACVKACKEKDKPYIAVTKLPVYQRIPGLLETVQIFFSLLLCFLFTGSSFCAWLVKTSIFNLLVSSLALCRLKVKWSSGLKGNPYKIAVASTRLCLLPR